MALAYSLDAVQVFPPKLLGGYDSMVSDRVSEPFHLYDLNLQPLGQAKDGIDKNGISMTQDSVATVAVGGHGLVASVDLLVHLVDLLDGCRRLDAIAADGDGGKHLEQGDHCRHQEGDQEGGEQLPDPFITFLSTGSPFLFSLKDAIDRYLHLANVRTQL